MVGVLKSMARIVLGRSRFAVIFGFPKTSMTSGEKLSAGEPIES
jgi:hypothetical protein